ncbi:hypothetical protein BS78_03G249000 [Paspalum vaginatum]|nr:hypothetical protein BS78_03G249000 [Paspalum vaginatum]
MDALAAAGGRPAASPPPSRVEMLAGGSRVRAGHLQGLRLSLSSLKKAPPRDVKAVCVPVGDNSSLGPVDDHEFGLFIPRLLEVSEHDYVSDQPGHLGDEDEFDQFYRVLSKKTATLFGEFPPSNPLAVSDEDKAVQEKFKEMANKCIDLLVDTMRRISPLEKRRALFPTFGAVYPVFASVRCSAEAGRATWWEALRIIEKLEAMRKMVSGACGTPLPVPVNANGEQIAFDRKVALTPLDCEALAGHGVNGSNLPVVIFVLIDSIYSTVKSDIDGMISASTTP